MLCRFFCNIGLLWFPGKKSCIIKVKDKELKIHRYWLPGRLLCSIRSNRKWCKRRGSSLECQNCFFVYPIIDSNLTNCCYLYYTSLPIEKIVYFMKLVGGEQLAAQGVPRWQVHKRVAGGSQRRGSVASPV